MRKITISLLTAAAALTVSATSHAADKVLTVYTYESFTAEWGPGPKVKEAFEKSCGCEVNFVGVEDGVALLNRLKLEGEETKADIVLGLDTGLIADAKATGLFAPADVDTSAVSVPGGFSDEVFVPYDYGHFAVVYDTEAMQNPPKSMQELVDGDASQKIVIEDPRTSTPGLGLLLWVKSIYGDKAGEAWSKLKDRVLTVTPGWSEAYGMFTNGEAPMVLSYTTSPAYHMIAEDTDRYQAASFSEGHYIQIEVAGRTKTSENPELAKRFLSFMVSPAFQDIIPETNWMFPAAKTSAPLADAFDKLVHPENTFLMSAEEVSANRKAWVDEWLAAMGTR
ncbi:thiamine ABC transporter substrate binding subunit [Rhizobium sp. L1K21]|uniref:thiamine ABC transporter substrate binding subunit n=1 Tax=Rhizobium sp. L1K21 TaxID=2954933 RepID=UPI002093C828|nr:thiamine ABC transporter substrate binding subunit [Rhizobium sp. L1K21]MCO6188060.1 thiamine ABC transporter substrate binding subunit [Rhizobium sp. L1K21]